MSVFVVGNRGVAFTVGVSKCSETNDSMMPFFAIAPSKPVEEFMSKLPPSPVYGGEKTVMDAEEVFRTHGTVVYFNDMSTTENLIAMLIQLVHDVNDTEWADRKANRETIQ